MTLEMRWAQRVEWDEERKRDPKCQEFPDHSCAECHQFHKDVGEFNKFCTMCSEEKCPDCDGLGCEGDIECGRCNGSGRISEDKL